MLRLYLPYKCKFVASDQHLHETSAPHVHCSVIHSRHDMETRCLPTREWIRCGDTSYTVESHPATRKGEILPFVTTWVDFGGIMLRAMADREGLVLYAHIYGLNLQSQGLGWGTWETQTL